MQSHNQQEAVAGGWGGKVSLPLPLGKGDSKILPGRLLVIRFRCTWSPASRGRGGPGNPSQGWASGSNLL